MKPFYKKYGKYFVFSIIIFSILGIFSQSFGENLPLVRAYGITESKTYQDLLSQVKNNQRIRIILGLKKDLIRPKPLNEEYLKEIKKRQKSILNFAKTDQIKHIKSFTYTPYMVLEVNEQGLVALTKSPWVSNIEEDKESNPTLLESIPLIGADDAWELGYTGEGLVVGVLDTGIDKYHSFLSGKVLHEICFSTSDTQNNRYSLCPGGGSYEEGPETALPCTINSNECRHGTLVAGVAAGKGTTMSGVALDASLISVQVYREKRNANDPQCGQEGKPACECSKSSTSCPVSLSSDQISALERLYELKNDFQIASINMSFGGGSYTDPCDTDSRADMIGVLKESNIATVIASGNNGYTNATQAPACITDAISVGYTDDLDKINTLSNSAYFLDLLAPGTNIYTSAPGETYINASGTSLSAPHVAGAIALLKEALPYGTINDYVKILKMTGKSILDERNGLTFPRIDLEKGTLLECPQLSSDWQIQTPCSIKSDTVIPGNLTIKPEAALFIEKNVSVDIDLENFFLLIEQGGKIFLDEGAKIF